MSRYPANIITKSPATPTGPTTVGRAPGIWRMDEVAYWTKQGVWPNANIQAADTFFPNVSLLLSTTALGNANNNLFADSSGAFNPVSRFGNTTQGSFTPYSTNWSNYFAGAGSYLQTPANSATTIVGTLSSTANLTIECWIFPTAYNSSANFPGLIGDMVATAENNNWSWGITNTGTLMLYWNISGTQYRASTTSTVSLNTWTHIALNVAAGAITMYINGVSQTLTGTTTLGTPSGSNNYLVIGQWNNGSGGTGGTSHGLYTGYISNLRVVKASTYTSNFTVPTAPLSAITSTSLLTCQSNRFRDASTNNLTLTVAGNMAVTDFGPFSPTYPGLTGYNQSDITNWSGYFDGSGDYLSVPNNAALNMSGSTFTLECWIYPNGDYSDYRTIMSKRNASTTSYQMFLFQSSGYLSFSRANTAYQSSATPTANAWNHVAAVYDGTNINLYLNGTRVLQTAVSIADTTDPLLIGAIYTGGENFNGYMSNVRVLKGVQAYSGATITVPTTPLTAISGTSLLTLQNAAFTDNSTNNFVITPFGNATVNGNSPFNTVGYWSLYGPSTAGATVPQTTATDLGSGSFTVECWVNLQDYFTDGIVTKRRTNGALTGSWGLFVNTGGFVIFRGVGWGTTYTAGTGAIPINTWTHIAVSRSGTNLSVFVNGVRVINATDNLNYTCSAYTIIKLGGNSGGDYPSGGALNGGVTGSVSNLRIVQGTAVYDPASTTITVPTAPLTAISGTSFLTLQNGTLKDNSTNNNTNILLYDSAAAIQPYNPFYTSTIASNGGSMYFDGSGDYLQVPTNASLQFGTSDFTVEFWMNLIARDSSGTAVFNNYNSFTTGALGFFAGHASASSTVYQVAVNGTFPAISSTQTIVYNSWNHFAIVRNGNTLTLYINGVANGTFSMSGITINGVGSNWWLGSAQDAPSNYELNGYLANFRVSKFAVYTAAFTPPTAPLTPSANTTLLLNGMNAGIYDATTINDMETVGNAQVRFPTPFAPADYYAGAFDGSGDYLTVPNNTAFDFGSGNFTIEMWVYRNNATNPYALFAKRDSSDFETKWVSSYINTNGTIQVQLSTNGSTWAFNTATTSAVGTATWAHLAFVRNGSDFSIYVDGVKNTISAALSGSVFTDTNPVEIGQLGLSGSFLYSMNGSISNFRIVKGTAVYTSNFTPPTSPLTAISGTSLLTCQNKTFIDNSSNAFTITAFGNATAGAIGPFTATGGTSVYFDGSGDALAPRPNPAFAFGTGSFTIEAWVNVISYAGTCAIFDTRTAGNEATGVIFYITASGQLSIYNNGTLATSSGSISPNTWAHVAVTRNGTTVTFWINGASSGTATVSTNFTQQNGYVGTAYNASSNPFYGYMDDLRVTNGVARYTSNFTPPTQAFPVY